MKTRMLEKLEDCLRDFSITCCCIYIYIFYNHKNNCEQIKSVVAKLRLTFFLLFDFHTSVFTIYIFVRFSSFCLFEINYIPNSEIFL